MTKMMTLAVAVEAAAVLAHVRRIAVAHAKLMLFGSLLLVQEHHVPVRASIAVKHHVILQARCLVQPMDALTVLHNVIMAVHLVKGLVLVVAVEAAAHRRV